VGQILKSKKDAFQQKGTQDFQDLVSELNFACFYFPVRDKYLELSAALTLMALNCKWKCNLGVGSELTF